MLRIRSSFAAKAAAAAALVLLGDQLFWVGGGLGSNLGLFALAWAIAALALAPAAWRDWRSCAAGGAALLLAAVLADRPGLLAFALFWSALAMAMLLPRFGGFDHAGRWTLRLVVHGTTSLIGPWRDLFRLRRHVGGRARMRALLPLLPLPLVGGLVFFTLFASANPVISEALLRMSGPEPDFVTVIRAIFWMVLLTLVWAAFRPRRRQIGAMVETSRPILDLPGVSVGSVTLALWTFNLLFAVQNGLDLAFLWSGAPLPAGVTLADYAHRGAYPLIATALLAGLFVLVTLRPGSTTAAVPAIRLLVVLWIVQNVFLVASSILRTIDYVDAYSLTRLRIAALVWMALVGLGLVLIVWRMLKARSAAWLINANAAAALLVLAACSVVDLGSIAAVWNVRHAREAGGKGAALDLCYLHRLGPSALVSLVRLEKQGGFTPEFADRLRWVRHLVLTDTIDGQSRGSWTWRNARRLDEVAAMLGGKRLPAPPPGGATGRGCDGAPLPPPLDIDLPAPATSAPSVGALGNAAVPAVPAGSPAALTNEPAQ